MACTQLLVPSATQKVPSGAKTITQIITFEWIDPKNDAKTHEIDEEGVWAFDFDLVVPAHLAVHIWHLPNVPHLPLGRLLWHRQITLCWQPGEE